MRKHFAVQQGAVRHTLPADVGTITGNQPVWVPSGTAHTADNQLNGRFQGCMQMNTLLLEPNNTRDIVTSLCHTVQLCTRIVSIHTPNMEGQNMFGLKTQKQLFCREHFNLLVIY